MGQVRPQALRSAPRVTPRAAEVNDHRRDALPRGRAGDAAPSATDRSDVDQGGRSWGRRTRRRPRRQGAAPAVAERAASLGCDGLDVDHARGSRRCARRRAPVRERQGTPRHAGQLQRLDVDQGGRRTLRARGCARIVDQLAGVPATLRARGCRARRRAHSTAAERGSRARLLVGERWLSVDGVTRHAWGCRPNRTALIGLRPARSAPVGRSAPTIRR